MRTRMARLLTRMARMARMLTRMTRWLAGSHIIHTRYLLDLFHFYPSVQIVVTAKF